MLLKLIGFLTQDGLEGFRLKVKQQEEDENRKILGEILRQQ